MKLTRFILAAFLVVGFIPAAADTIFSDLGPSSNAYQAGTGVTVKGGSFASSFSVGGNGVWNLTQLELGVGYYSSSYGNGFSATIWTDNNGTPGTQVSGASWTNLTSPIEYGFCCSLVSVSGISGVTLNGGQQYFIVLSAPMSNFNVWNENNQGATGLDLYSTGALGPTTNWMNWAGEGTATSMAFALQGNFTPSDVPEPGTILLLGTGLCGIGAIRRKFVK